MTKAERETLKAEYITGDYRTLKEFAEAKGFSYQDVKNYAFKEKWNEAKVEHNKRIADEIITASEKKKAQDGLEQLEERNNTSLEAAQRLKTALLQKIEEADAKELNALCSALYRIVEVETNLLATDKSKSEQAQALDDLCAAITSASLDDVNGDDSNG